MSSAPFSRNDDTAGASDSAGIPFGGRHLTSTGFDNDTGASDPVLVELLRRGDESAWMAHLSDARLIVPIVAAPAEIDDSGELAVEKETDMAVVTLRAPDGVTALPVFTGLETLAAWNPQARPSPVKATAAAQAALAEGCDLMLLDLGSEHFVTLRRPMVEAVATTTAWAPLDQDPVVLAAVDAAVAPHRALIRSVTPQDAGDGVLRVRLALAPGLAGEQLRSIAQVVGEHLAGDEQLRARIEGVEFVFDQA